LNVLVLGVGSILMMDEGIGVRAIEELVRRYRFPEGVEVLTAARQASNSSPI
jgi:hydrogenase maturation protease